MTPLRHVLNVGLPFILATAWAIVVWFIIPGAEGPPPISVLFLYAAAVLHAFRYIHNHRTLHSSMRTAQGVFGVGGAEASAGINPMAGRRHADEILGSTLRDGHTE